MSPARNVSAVVRFAGGPGREREAAEAWAFELTYYFLRGVGEAPVVTYSDGAYICTGLMTTTHPGDTSPVTVFTTAGMSWNLDFAMDADRQKRLREMYGQRGERFDGREDGTMTSRELADDGPGG